MKTIENMKNLYNSRQKAVNLFNNFTKLDLNLYAKQNKEQDLKY